MGKEKFYLCQAFSNIGVFKIVELWYYENIGGREKGQKLNLSTDNSLLSIAKG